jgi:large subunit ribosomal protein L30
METITIRWKKSIIGKGVVQRKTIQSLGFKRMNQTLTLPDRPETRGMINRVSHLLEIVKESERKPG